MNAYINATGNGYDSGSSGQAVAMNATGNGSNTNQSGQAIAINKPVENPTGATGNGSNTNQSSSIDNNNTNTPSSGQAATSYNPTTSPTVANPTGATGHGSTVYSGGQAENKPTINPDAVGHSAEEKKAITDLYTSDGNDYYIDDNALSNAQMRTGDDKKADSVVGSGGSDDSETNSNVNTGVFGGPARAAHPGYSLW